MTNMKIFPKGQIIAVPYYSKQLKRFLRSPGGKRTLYPARVILSNCGGPNRLRPCIVVRYLDGLPDEPVLINEPSNTCCGLYDDVPSSSARCEKFDELVEKERREPSQSALERWRANKASQGKGLIKERIPNGEETVTAKWAQRCMTSGAKIEPGDTIVKTNKGWSLQLQTPPVSPRKPCEVVRPPPRRSKRLAAQQKLQLD